MKVLQTYQKMSIILKKREMLKLRKRKSCRHHHHQLLQKKRMKVSQKSHLGKQEDFKTTILEGMETAKHQVWRAQLSRVDFHMTV
ncbi:hypothetical protein LUU34_00751200 [Aix galericulata]|nr:hypothetical protein LUU34_00751200 [Aix galericulata]